MDVFITRFTFALCLPVFFALSLVGCDKSKSSSSTPSQTGQSVRLLLDWKPEPEFGGFYQAQLSGNFQKHGLHVELKSAGEGAPTWQFVANGQAEFATTAADQVIVARQRGADVVALFAVYQTFPQGILVHRSRGFTSLKDVFTHPGTLAAEDNSWLHYCMEKFGTPVVKITGYTGGIATFLAKDDFSQQCFVTSEPIEAQRKGSDPQTFLIAEAGFNPYATVVITQGKLLREKPELARAMVAACREGWRAYLDDAAAANQHMHQLNTEMDSETFKAAAEAQRPLIETADTVTNGLGSMTAERWKTLGQQLADLKVIASAPPPEECFVNLK